MRSSKITVMSEKPNIEFARTVLTPASPCRFTESGYVTWSSTSWGLRPGQSANTITWFSLKSGIASTGVRYTARMPHATAKSTAHATRNRLRRDHSMRRLIIDFGRKKAQKAQKGKTNYEYSRNLQTV